jgi:hypothetical protein
MMNKILKYPWPCIQNFISAFYPYLKFFTSSKKSYIVSFVLTLSIVMIDVDYGFESNDLSSAGNDWPVIGGGSK